MREAGRTLKEATDLTNELLVGNAERLRQGNLEARTQLERGVFDIEAVKQANASLVATIEDSLRIAQDAQAQRASATKELEKAGRRDPPGAALGPGAGRDASAGRGLSGGAAESAPGRAAPTRLSARAARIIGLRPAAKHRL